MDLFVGIDLGTSALKAVLGDGEGRILRSARVPYRTSSPHPGWSEIDPRLWEEALYGALRELREGTSSWDEVRALSFSGQMHGLVLLDWEGIPLRPAILWNDSRNAEEVEYLNEGERRLLLLQETGNIALCGFTLPKILWVRKNEPEIFERTARILLPKDYLAYRLTGRFASEASDLSGTLLFDVARGCYSEKALALAGIREEMLPEVLPSTGLVGSIGKETSARSGLPEGCQVVIGGGDQAIGALGAGILGEGLLVSLGTSGVLLLPEDSYSYDPEGRLHSFRRADGGYLLMGCTLSAADSLRWWAEGILSRAVPEVLSALPEETEEEVLFLPYLMGERSPINDPRARGTFWGMTSSTSAEEMALAVMEGVAFSLYDVYRAMGERTSSLKEMRLIGGGARSPLWRRMLTDLIGLPARSPLAEEGPSCGAYLVARSSCKGKPLAELVQGIPLGESVLPDPERGERLRAKYARYKELYRRLKGF